MHRIAGGNASAACCTVPAVTALQSGTDNVWAAAVRKGSGCVVVPAPETGNAAVATGNAVLRTSHAKRGYCVSCTAIPVRRSTP